MTNSNCPHVIKEPVKPQQSPACFETLNMPTGVEFKCFFIMVSFETFTLIITNTTIIISKLETLLLLSLYRREI